MQRSRASSTALLRALVTCGLGIAAGLACTPTLEFQQCRDDVDCTNSRQLDLVCSESHECVPRPEPGDVTCSSSQECVDAFDENHVCGVGAVCTPLTSEHCTKVNRPADTAADDIVWLGSILATSPPFDTSIVPIENAVQLAVEDFNEVTTLPGGKRVGWIGCDSVGTSSIAVEAARHLVETVGVEAIVGPTFSAPTIDVAREVTISNEAFLISPTASSPTITDLDDGGLVWRTINSDVYQASALADRLAALDPVPERVLVLAKNDAYGQGITQSMSPRVKELLPDVRQATLLYPDPVGFASNEQLLSAYGAVIAEGFPHQADTVVLVGTNEVRDLTLFYLAVRDDQNPVPPLPRFLYAHGGVPVMESTVEAVSAGFRPSLMQALEGVSPIIQDTDNFQAYNIRYKIRFMDQDALTASSLGYDAAMVTLLSMLSIEQGPVTGVGIAQGMTRLVDHDAPIVDFSDGLSFIETVAEALAAGQNVDLQGVSGALDFDLLTGEPRTDLIGWGLVPKDGQPEQPVLTPVRRYVLDEPPAVTGTWMEL